MVEPTQAGPAGAPALEDPIVTFGEVLWDVYPNAEHLGGCAANVAHHLAVIGAPAALVSRVGRDGRGARARELLSRSGVDVRHVQVDPSAPTGAVRVTIEAGEPRFSIVDEAAWDRIAIDDAVTSLLGRARGLVYGTLAQRTVVGRTALGRARRLCPPHCVRVVDLNLRPPFVSRDVVDDAIAGATIVKLNETEARAVEDLFGVSNAAAWLVERRGVRLVAVTRGSGGASLTTRDGDRRFPAPAIDAGGDAVGAGDAFTAVLVWGMCERWELDRVGTAATAYASWVASRPGATPMPLESEIERLLAV